MSNRELEEKMVEEIRKSDVPVNTEYLAKKTAISWSRASRMLLRLALQGKIAAVETINGWVFSAKQNETIEVTG